VPLNTWTHLAATYDAVTGQSLYLNGVQVANVSPFGNIVTSIGPLRIGGNSIFGEYYVGTIDDVRVYNRALSQTEIMADMNTPVGTQGACVLSPAYWVRHPAGRCMGRIKYGSVTCTGVKGLATMRH